MSHELRTPMISIIGYSDILHDIAGDDETKEISSILHQSALRLTDTINTILDLSMLESGSLYLQLNKVDIGDILEKIGRSYSEKIGKKTIKLINNIPPATFFVEADLRLLMQVIDNVFNNALKYTETGSVTFSAFRDAGNIIFSVADTGIGIKKEHFAIIFEEFRQVSEGLDRRYEGSGLGLHVSKRFVEKMNGKIWVDSEFGKGSTFYVSLKEFSVS
jgi:signal transduction histidine kinase